MSSAKSVNSFKSGLNLSIDPIDQVKDSYSYALNVVKEDSINNPDIITNERGFTKYLDLGYEYNLLGSVYLGKENYVLFIKNIPGTSSFNRIILLQSQTPTTIYDTVNLNFQDENVIKGTYRINYKNQRVIYWVDGLNDDRVLNIDGTITGDVDELSIDVRYNPAVLTSKTVEDSGGSLVTGTYEFFAAYKTLDNAVSPWFILTANPIYIIDDNTQSISTSGYIVVDGCDSNIPTNKAIQLNIDNLDPRFSILQIGIIKTLDGNSTATYIDNIFYSTTSISYNYTGNSTETIIPDISELIVDTVKYYGSNAIIQMDNRLLRANMSSNKIDIGYQTYANNIITDYYIQEELVGSMPDSTDYTVRSDWWKSANTKYSDTKSLMRDEVYSLGIAFGLIKEDTESEVYHIPGRVINSIPDLVYRNQYNDTPTIPYSATWDTTPITENGITAPAWKVINTAAKSDDSSTHKLAYWESSNMYPPNLNLPTTGSSTTGANNTPIRHHKMPSSGLEPIFRTNEVSGVINFYKRHLGLNFSNIQVPDSLIGNISYIRIYITSRIRDENKSIVAKGIFTNCSLTKINIGDFSTVSDNLYIHPCAPYNDQNEITNGDCYMPDQDDGWETTSNYYHSFYSPDTTLANPVVSSNKVLIENEFTGVVQYYNTIASMIDADPFLVGSPGHTDSSTNGGYKRDIFYDDSNNGVTLPTGQTSSHAVINTTPGNFRTTYKSLAILNTINQIQSNKSRRNLKQVVYVPFNANLSVDQLGGMDNPYISEYGASNVLLELNPLYSNLGATATTDTSVQFTDNDGSQNYLDPAQSSDIEGTFHFHTIESPLAVYRYGSIKKDNSTQYGSIDGLEYNPTDLVIANPTFSTDNILNVSCGGLIGDSWIDMLSVKRTRFAQKQEYTFGGKPEISIGISTFFTESNINHRLRYAEGIDFREYYPKQVLSTSIKEYLDANFNPPIFFDDNYYKQNTDYNKQVTKKNFGQSQLDADLFGITSYITRILYSEKLLDESRVDSYRQFLANNYRDLPKDRGFITHLFKKNQELYAVTRDSLWRVYASNETIRSDTSNISIGTGEFLSLEPNEMLSIEGGYGGSSSKFSLAECPYGYFYVDKNKGKLILFRDRQSYFDNSQQVDISLVGVFNFIRDNFKIDNTDIVDFDLPLLNLGYIAGYDPELKRILVTKLDYELTSTQLTHFRGVFNPLTSYTAGDIYTKSGTYYQYDSSSSSYTIVSESSNLSDFVSGSIDNESFTFTTPSHGTVVATDSNTLVYTPTTSYTGSDALNITMNCTVTTVNITVAAPPTSVFVTPFGDTGGDNNFVLFASIDNTLINDLVVDMTTNYIQGGVSRVGPGVSITIPVGQISAHVAAGSYDPTLGSITSVTCTVLSATPNPNGGVTITF